MTLTGWFSSILTIFSPWLEVVFSTVRMYASDGAWRTLNMGLLGTDSIVFQAMVAEREVGIVFITIVHNV